MEEQRADDEQSRLKSFEDLKCWQACTEVRRYIMRLVKKYPPHEKYRLVDNMVRASRSTTHSIAEGYGRFHYQENIQFCRHSRGSLAELTDQLICSLDEEYITREEYHEGRELIKKATMLVNGYIRYLRKRKEEPRRAKGGRAVQEEEAEYAIWSDARMPDDEWDREQPITDGGQRITNNK